MSIPSRYSRKKNSALSFNVHPDLTFGIELELLIIIQSKFFLSSLTEKELGLIKRNGLKRARAIVQKRLYSLLHDKIAIHEPFASYETGYGLKRNYSKWDLSHDSLSLLPGESEVVPRDQGYEVASVEIISRKFHYIKDDWQSELVHVCRAIQSLNNHPRCCAITNCQTGFHVHVGLKGGFTQKAVKNVMMVTAAFERLFDQLHPRCRVRNDSKWCRPTSYLWSKCYVRHQLLADGNPFSLTESERHIHAIKSLPMGSKLYEIYHHPQVDRPERNRYAIVNYRNLELWDGKATSNDAWGKPRPKTGTIEFRQHRSTTDFVEIANWVQVVARIVSVAANDGYEARKGKRVIHRLVEDHHLDPAFTLKDLLKTFSIHSNIVKFYVNRWNGKDKVSYKASDTGNGPLAELKRRNHYGNAKDSDVERVAAVINEKLKFDHYGLKPPHVKMVGSDPHAENAKKHGWRGVESYLITGV